MKSVSDGVPHGKAFVTNAARMGEPCEAVDSYGYFQLQLKAAKHIAWSMRMSC